jgi:hypothetical protein
MSTYNLSKLSDGVQIRFGTLVATASQCIGRSIEFGTRVQNVHSVSVRIQFLNGVEQVLVGLRSAACQTSSRLTTATDRSLRAHVSIEYIFDYTIIFLHCSWGVSRQLRSSVKHVNN